MLELYMSNPQLDLLDVAKIIATHRIESNISAYFYTRSDGQIEQGCKVTMFDTPFQPVRDMWSDMQAALNVHCAWINFNNYNGCILDYQEKTQ